MNWEKEREGMRWRSGRWWGEKRRWCLDILEGWGDDDDLTSILCAVQWLLPPVLYSESEGSEIPKCNHPYVCQDHNRPVPLMLPSSSLWNIINNHQFRCCNTWLRIFCEFFNKKKNTIHKKKRENMKINLTAPWFNPHDDYHCHNHFSLSLFFHYYYFSSPLIFWCPSHKPQVTLHEFAIIEEKL